jgi:hypothetical protein
MRSKEGFRKPLLPSRLCGVNFLGESSDTKEPLPGAVKLRFGESLEPGVALRSTSKAPGVIMFMRLKNPLVAETALEGVWFGSDWVRDFGLLVNGLSIDVGVEKTERPCCLGLPLEKSGAFVPCLGLPLEKSGAFVRARVWLVLPKGIRCAMPASESGEWLLEPLTVLAGVSSPGPEAGWTGWSARLDGDRDAYRRWSCRPLPMAFFAACSG